MDTVKKSKFNWKVVTPPDGIDPSDWNSWKWQMSHSLKSLTDFSKYFDLSSPEEEGFKGAGDLFRIQSTPYYARLASGEGESGSIRQMLLPQAQELVSGSQQMADPLGENQKNNRPCERLIHRYTDRALFLATDMCGMYCRYCTRKHFTASDQVMATDKQVEEAVAYVKAHPEIKEVIFSGGDPLTLGNSRIERMLAAFYEVPSVELIRVGSRIPVVNPFRIDQDLVEIFKSFQPIYFMTHFNHPDEITEDSARALSRLVDGGIPVFNQLVLLNGINNDADLIYALSRRLLYLRVKPHYMFQADPSLGTDHLRNSIEDSLDIQKKLWGHSSGLAMPQYIVDIPDGGGKAALTPEFLINQEGNKWNFQGWDGVKAQYISPDQIRKPFVSQEYRRS